MNYFLQDIAEKIIQNPCYQSDKSIIVFPNRRAGIFLRKYLKTSDKTFFMPQIMGMDDFVSQTSGMGIVKNEFLLFELFRIHKEISKTTNNDKYQTFEDFIPFADMLLKDFSDVDLHLADAKQIFTLLYNEKQIGEWDISNPDQLSEFQQKYLAFYESLYDYYTKLQERLKEANKAYSAMLYRNVAENIDFYADTLKWNKILFVGFCEISQSEYKIIDSLKRRGIAEFEADIDKYYMENGHEAGLMPRRNASLWKKDGYELPEYFKEEKRNFKLVSCPENTLQSEYVGNLLKKLTDTQDNTENTVIVLADENLLIPTLNGIPQCVDKINITMGFPYTYTLTHNLLLCLLDMYENRQQDEFYVKSLIQFLSHSIMEKNLGISNLRNRLTERFSKEKRFYIDGENILEIIPEIRNCGFEFLFSKKDIQPEELIEIYKTLALKTYPNCTTFRERISTAASYEIFDHFAELQQEYRFAETINILRKIYQRIAVCIQLSFKGEPLEGLQIMGLQETKNIDFRNIILVSCNEGVVPKGNSHNSLIPYNIRQNFEMFTYRDRDAADAYNFYRMLQRAENVHFIYQTDVEGGGKGEPSRFLTQIKKELARKYPNITLHEETVSINQKTDSKPITLSKAKDERVMESLAEMAATGYGFSPSALNKYRHCTLSYYYEVILGITPSAELEEDIDNSELGTQIHAILQQIFGRFLNSDINVSELPTGKELTDIIEQHFDENIFKNHRNRSGENYFMLSVAKTQIQHFIKQQIEFLNKHSGQIVCLEEDLKYKLHVTNNLDVVLHGIADRIEYVDGILRICDYKSGKVEDSDLAIYGDFFESENPFVNKKISDKWFQVMYYAWLYHKNHGTGQLEAGIFPLQNLGKFFIKASAVGENTVFGEKEMNRFEKYLIVLLSELFDKETDFVQTTDSKNCSKCHFKNLCGKDIKTF